MDAKNQVKIGIRNLVEFVMRSGDLDSRFFGGNRALEGTKAHQKVQKCAGEEYSAEVYLSNTFEYEGFIFTIDGRADGIITEGSEVIVDEIKSTTRPLEIIDENYNSLHWAQAKCYGYIYALQNDIDNVIIQLTYFQIDTEQIKRIRKTFTIEELKTFFYKLIDLYLLWAKLTSDWNVTRNESIKALQFPFSTYRKGQRELAIAVYRTISENKRLFAQAPTGIGKTISTLFPTIKAVGEGSMSKIFYLTAKTITRQVAEEAFYKMSVGGLRFKVVTLTAKDKICFKEESNCNPDVCEYAKGHFNRVNEALMDILTNEDVLNREKIEEYAKKHKICPFEFSLDISIWADCIICDYNYAFDPRVYLKRFFEHNNESYAFLVDEAHNLVDRAREMFSAEINKSTFLDLKKKMKEKQPKISKALGKINKFMLDVKKELKTEKYRVDEEQPSDLYPLLRHFVTVSEDWLASNEKTEEHSELLELYFNVLAFIKISEMYDERYITYIEKNSKDVRLKLFCLDPSYLLGEAIKRGKSAVFFSATLTPLTYFRDILGGCEDDYIMQLPSPFDKEKLCLCIADSISTKYKDRESTYGEIVDYIKVLVSQRCGNYLVFFPSYKYMNDVYSKFIDKYPEINTIIQSNIMSENEREEFLDNFNKSTVDSLIAFAVLGGIFSEGIDLTGERLIGAIVVGVGLPQICLERDIIKSYFDTKNNSGFEYAYMYPGMTKVLQAAGRVIRTEADKGVVLLIDERFSYSYYQRLFPIEWSSNTRIRTMIELENKVTSFWQEKNTRKKF